MPCSLLWAVRQSTKKYVETRNASVIILVPRGLDYYKTTGVKESRDIERSERSGKSRIEGERNVPPSCNSTLFLADTSNNAFDLSSTTRMSFLPIICNVGVEYGADEVRREAQRGPLGIKPETDTQNELGM